MLIVSAFVSSCITGVGSETTRIGLICYVDSGEQGLSKPKDAKSECCGCRSKDAYFNQIRKHPSRKTHHVQILSETAK